MESSSLPVVISIDGGIAVGKSTLCDLLAEAGYVVFREGADDRERWAPALERFYQNPHQGAFALQVAILCDMRAIYDKIGTIGDMQKVVFVERSPLSARDIFLENSYAMGHIHEVDMAVYNRLEKHVGWEPNHVISLETSPEVAFQRMRKRGRDAETSVSLDYIRDIHTRYKTAVRRWGENINKGTTRLQSILSIDASQDTDCIFREVVNYITCL